MDRFWIQRQTDNVKIYFLDFLSAEKYARRKLHENKGGLIQIKSLSDNSLVAECKLSSKYRSVTLITLPWSGRVKLKPDCVQLKSKKTANNTNENNLSLF